MSRLTPDDAARMLLSGESGPSEYDSEHMMDILAGEGDWFSAYLLRLIAKADADNKRRLQLVFPEHVRAYNEWYLNPQSPPPPAQL